MANEPAVADHLRTISKRSRSAWLLPKPKSFGPTIPHCMDDAYWDGAVAQVGVVYFLGAFPYDDPDSLGLVKIGFSTDLAGRLNNLCSNMGMMKGRLLATAKGGNARERAGYPTEKRRIKWLLKTSSLRPSWLGSTLGS